MVQASEAQKQASRRWYEKTKEASAIERKAKYAENKEVRQRFRNNAKRSYYKRKLAELGDLEHSDDSDTGLVEVQIERPPSPDAVMMKLNNINYIMK